MQRYIYVVFLSLFATLKFDVLAELQYSDRHSYSEDDNLNDVHHMYSDYGSNYHTYTDKNGDMDIPIILWWTSASLYPHPDRQGTVIQCGDVQCYSSANRKQLTDERTRGIMFYGTDFDPTDLPLPRASQHEWALFHEESPLNNFILNHNIFLKLINHTATFRRESDYPITTQNIYHPDFLTIKQPLPLTVKNEKRKKNNLAPVLYVQSHCEVPSDRDRYIEELMKHIDVDSYGSCLHNKDLPDHLVDPASNFEKDEFLELIQSYKFHLAFENAICKDYMTEKLMRPLHIGSVPIYRGSPNAKDWMPNDKSIILVDDFESPKELADYIKYLDTHDEAYEKYLEFKKPGGVKNKMLIEHLANRKWHVNIDGSMEYFRGFECHICHKLNERYTLEKAHEIDPTVELLPPKTANVSHLGCPQPYTSLGHPEDIKNTSDPWRKMEWVEMYWEGFDQARAVRNMLLNHETKPSKYKKYLRKI
ncbi:alpha-(1,3)-fucosyltransferase 11 [Patella vulgata]|uniref:alpha-(1,3)-fucosyltransferase 11 n=1 Tax=Patella vulgata TaxID=6465 RepID=UPI0024A98F17|nr:alpha-(1,3)-fucosyltransferase 11 [Patella vulgata]XP_050390783.2 alpha-(1,3)-fucosyltransferase 11 [Patella vulgata]